MMCGDATVQQLATIPSIKGAYILPERYFRVKIGAHTPLFDMDDIVTGSVAAPHSTEPLPIHSMYVGFFFHLTSKPFLFGLMSSYRRLSPTVLPVASCQQSDLPYDHSSRE